MGVGKSTGLSTISQSYSPHRKKEEGGGGRQDNAPCCLCPKPQNAGMLTFHGKRDFKTMIQIKDLKLERLSWIILGRRTSDHWNLEKQRTFPSCGQGEMWQWLERCYIAGFENERKPWAKECKGPLEGKEMDSLLGPPERIRALLTPWFWSSEAHVTLLHYGTVSSSICDVLSHEFAVICYGNNRKLIERPCLPSYSCCDK